MDNIWNYTAKEWSTEQADKYYHLLYECIQKLQDCPSYLQKDYNDVKPGLLGCHVGHHIIFYKRGKDDSVWIDRILHERMDFHRHL